MGRRTGELVVCTHAVSRYVIQFFYCRIFLVRRTILLLAGQGVGGEGGI